MKSLLLVFVLLSGCLAHAEIDLELSRDNSDSSYSNNVSLGYELESKNLRNGLTYSFSNSLTVVNLNSNLPDFEISYEVHDLSYTLSIADTLTLDLNYSLTRLNDKEAQINQYSGGLYYKYKKVQIGLTSSTSKTMQNQDVVILSRNYKDDIKFEQKAFTYYIDAQWTESLLTSFKYTYYAYDENLDNFNTLLTTQAALNRAGGSVANEVQTQLRNASELDLIYVLDQNWMFDLGVGSSQDYLAPSEKTSEGKLGIEYETEYEDVTYKLFYTLNGQKAAGDQSATASHLLGLGVSF